MAAPKGNKHAVGNPGPPSSFDLDAIAKEMLEWSMDPQSLKFTNFTKKYYIKHKIILNLQRFSEWNAKSVVFAEAYRISKQNLDDNRHAAMCANILPPAVYAKSEGLYDVMSHDYFEDLKDKDAERKVKQTQAESALTTEETKRILATIEKGKNPVKK